MGANNNQHGIWQLSIVFVLNWAAQAKGSSNPYCEITSCANPREHVMCVYDKDESGPNCTAENYLADSGLDDEDKINILHAHNQLRNLVANGTFAGARPLGRRLPTADDINELLWDDELEMFAERWAKQCRVKEKDKCRDTAANSSVGQVVYVNTGQSRTPEHQVYSYFLMAATILTELFNFTKPAQLKHSELINLSQMLWARADRMGCARASTNKSVFTQVIVCNFNAGDDRSAPVYSNGDNCRYCFCSTEYKALCGNANEVRLSMLILAALTTLTALT